MQMMLRSLIYGQRLLAQACRLNSTVSQLAHKFSVLGNNTEINMKFVSQLLFNFNTCVVGVFLHLNLMVAFEIHVNA